MSRVTPRAGGISVDRFSVVLVAVAATLWASDQYFRPQLLKHLTAPEIVVAEDALVTLFLLPVLIRSRHEFAQLGKRGWLAVFVIAAGAQALANSKVLTNLKSLWIQEAHLTPDGDKLLHNRLGDVVHN